MVSGCDGQKPRVWKCAVPCLDSHIDAIRCDGKLLEQVEETHLKQICMWPNSSWANQRLSFAWLVSCLPSFEGLGESGQTLCILAEGKRRENPSHAQRFHLIQLISVESHLTIIWHFCLHGIYVSSESVETFIFNFYCLSLLQTPQTLMPKISAPCEPREAFGICEAFTAQGVTRRDEYHQRTKATV